MLLTARSTPRSTTALDLSLIAAGLAAAVTGDELPLPPGQDRSFVRLLLTPRYEAWLIAWAPAGGLELHDHGGSRGAVAVAAGRLCEAYVDPGPDGRLYRRTLDRGSGVEVPAERIHEVWNPGPARALSVHVYAPRLDAMTYYRRDAAGGLVATRTSRGDVASLERL